jgi:NAD(P)H-dependent FMN reductase
MVDENVPKTVLDFRIKLNEADGILICTPEYAMGVPGLLKNAIDWTVSSCEFYHKPTALITASSLGEKGHASLLETLKVIDAKVTDKTQLLISFAKGKINNDYKITDHKTFGAIENLLEAFNQLMDDEQRNDESSSASNTGEK